ncbi:MAG: hypothetical protein LKI24_09780 [Acidipropionibacterium sp.]|jgi:hypothetical protein|nr:hypothetical protein [Acidipropionibacterium sp.]
MEARVGGADEFERDGVDDRGVPGGVAHEQRMAPGDAVQSCDVGVAPAEPMVVESSAQHPVGVVESAGILALGQPVGNTVVEGVENREIGEIDLGQGPAEPCGMYVDVVETGDDEGAIQVHPSIGDDVVEFLVEADDPAIEDTDSRCCRML